MSDGDDFRDLLARAAAGDGDAATDLVGRVEPRVRAAVRGQIDELNLRRVLDSADISQAVLARFFAGLADTHWELADADRVVALLVTMARNRVRDEARRERSIRRGGEASGLAADHLLAGLSATDPTPSRAASDKELVAAFFDRLPADIGYLAEQRAAGREWADLAAEVGGTPQSLRKRMARAVEKVAVALGVA